MGHTRWLTDEEKRAWTAFTTAHALLYRRLEQRAKGFRAVRPAVRDPRPAQ
ncbi:hypothetical protein [Streptomyces flaveus]|uniref:hypothetical protein n=1 Tax=Streptomyces flaveus TaxID=66370 RepID=UPI003332F003